MPTTRSSRKKASTERPNKRARTATHDSPLSCEWIETVDEMAAILEHSHAEISLPRIVVAGDQSSGKSTLVESLVGFRGFLPRGEGLTTRRPIRIQLRRDSTCEQPLVTVQTEADGEISEMQIGELAECLAQANESGPMGEAIVVTIRGPRVSHLTIIDTPGIVSNIDSDQHHQLKKQFRKILKREMGDGNQDEALILFVHRADSHINTSVAFKIIAPHFHRCIGVLTHVDLLKQHTLLPTHIQSFFRTQKGTYAVMNDPHDENFTTEQETEWFTRFLAPFPAERRASLAEVTGVVRLRERCARELTAAIQRTMQPVRWELEQKIDQTRKALEALGPNDISSEHAYHTYAERYLMTNYCRPISALIKQSDRASSLCQDVRTILTQLKLELSAVQNDTQDTLDHYRDMRGGIDTLGAFDSMARQHIELFREPVRAAAQRFYQRAQSLLKDVGTPDRYPQLRAHLHRQAMTCLQQAQQQTDERLKLLIDQECAYINLSHPGLEAPAQPSSSSSWRGWSWGKSSKLAEETAGIKLEVKTYCDLIRQQVEDQTMKIVWLSFFDASIQAMKSIIRDTPSEEALLQYMAESPAIAQQRQELERKYQQFSQAHRVLLRCSSTPTATPSEVVDLS